MTTNSLLVIDVWSLTICIDDKDTFCEEYIPIRTPS